MNAAAASPVIAPSTIYSSSVKAPETGSLGSGVSGDAMKAGLGPKNSLPTNVAMPVAVATGRNVLTLTSGNISSVTNRTPPIGVLNVAAMPAPAPGGDQRNTLTGREMGDLAESRTER